MRLVGKRHLDALLQRAPVPSTAASTHTPAHAGHRGTTPQRHNAKKFGKKLHSRRD
jgi:hypothetical protein